MFNGCAICPLLKLLDNTSAPKTWYNKMFFKSADANKSEAVIPKLVKAAVKAAFVGAKTVNSALASFKSADNPATSIAAFNVVWLGLP